MKYILQLIKLSAVIGMGFTTVCCSEDDSPSRISPGENDTIVEILIAPSHPVFTQGKTRTLVANAIYSNGAVEDVTQRVQWTSDAQDVATVSNEAESKGRVYAKTAAVAKISASIIGIVASTSVNVTPAAVQHTEPLTVSDKNPRYFADTDGHIVYLTGSHFWRNFQDSGTIDPPPVFDFNAFLEFLDNHNHNFFRLWTWEQVKWATETTDDYWFDPLPYARTGPGLGRDGKPKFDLQQFNQAYFDRMRSRVIEAGQHSMYVSVMLFNGWSIEDKNRGGGNPWPGHPYHRDNNINGIDGDPNGDNEGNEIHTLLIPEVTALQEAYVRKVIDTVNELNNVMYEISNESHGDSQDWQYHLTNYIKQYESSKPKQHPVGMTVEWRNGNNAELFASPADWISPNGIGYTDNPTKASGEKVILSDTDHLCGVCGDGGWVWKSFLRGINPVFMDVYDGNGVGVGEKDQDGNDPVWVDLRKQMGYTLDYARRINLESMEPNGTLVSTGYCLANTSETEYLVYLPKGGAVTIDLSGTKGKLAVEWFSTGTGNYVPVASIEGGSSRKLTAPFSGPAVLYLFQQ